MDFQFSTGQHFDHWLDPERQWFLFVESFDLQRFSLRVGSVVDSEDLGSCIAQDDATLNHQLRQLYQHWLDQRSR
ncbi:hypothetical protein V6U78_04020 [Marinospirillum sp. MEB164]|uniref:Uncharacterized protein n=1 Tax=Marinospirillum alkalitolerans TaxID=3123374 RepID=A0ABW8PV95_9GAMM